MAEMYEPRLGSGVNGGSIVPLTVMKEFRLDGSAPATAGNFGTIFWIADAAYELVSCTERHATAGSDGSAVTGMLTKAASGTAIGSGTAMLLAGINLKGTANTNISATKHGTAANTRVAAGNGVGFVLTGTPTALAGLCLQTVWKRI